jgi:hypothetical protein
MKIPHFCLYSEHSLLYYIIIFIIIYYYIINIIYYFAYISSDGLGVRVDDLYPRGHWFESLLEQFLLKTRTVNSVLRNRNMIGKFPTWWENSVLRNRNMIGKIPTWWENSVRERKKSLPLHGSFSTAAPVLYAGIYLPLFSQCSRDVTNQTLPGRE